MFDYIYEWMKNLAFYMVLVTAVLHAIPNSEYKKYIRFFTGLILVIMLASPVLRFFGVVDTYGSFRQSREYQEQIEKMEQSTQDLEENRADGQAIEVEEIEIGME